MILLAKEDVGYRNLLALTTASDLDGYYYKPRIDKELLATHPAELCNARDTVHWLAFSTVEMDTILQ